MKTALVTTGISQEIAVSITPEARAERDRLLALSGPIVSVTNPAENLIATQALKEISGFVSSVESARKTVKGPIVALGKSIDATADELASLVEGEKKRLSSMIGTFELGERRKREEAEQKRIAEETRLRLERESQLRQAQQVATTEAQFDRIADKIDERFVAKTAEIRLATASVATKPAGLGVREVQKYRVEDVIELFQNCPELVDLVPNNTKILAALRNGVEIPGVVAWKEAVASVR
jgi:hypothetical protein